MIWYHVYQNSFHRHSICILQRNCNYTYICNLLCKFLSRIYCINPHKTPYSHLHNLHNNKQNNSPHAYILIQVCSLQTTELVYPKELMRLI